MSEFQECLQATEQAASKIHDATVQFRTAVAVLFTLYQSGEGTKDQRDHALDHLEDAGLIKHRFKFGGS